MHPLPAALAATLAALLLTIPARAAEAEASLAPNFRFTVVDAATGKPLAGADVSLVSDTTFAEATTDEAGTCAFRVKDVRPRLFSVSVKAKGHVPLQVRWRSDQGVEPPDSFTLDLPVARTIGGRVVTEAGEGIANATVSPRLIERLSPPHAQPEINALLYNARLTTDSDGKWTCDQAPQSLTGLELTVSAEGFLAAKLSIKRDPALAASLMAGDAVTELSHGVELRGVVVGEDEKPIVGAEVRLDSRGVNGLPAGSTHTGPGGAFEFETVTPGESVLTVTAPDHSPLLMRLDIVGTGQSDLLHLVLTRGHLIEGTVVDDTGKPVAKATLTPERWRGQSTLEHSMTTDAEGKFRWEGAPADTVDYHISADGYVPQRMVPLKVDEPQTIVLKRRQVYWGRVSNAADGQSISNFMVRVGTLAQPGAAPAWIPSSRQIGREGFYQTNISEPDTTHVLEFTADGYRTLVTDALPTEGGLHELDVKLQPVK